jgi:hypothetical protein
MAITCAPQPLQAPPLADGEENTDPEAEAILADRPSKVVVKDYTVSLCFCLYLHLHACIEVWQYSLRSCVALHSRCC